MISPTATDAVTTRATKALQALFGGEPDVYFVFNGTGANLLALKTLTRSFNAVVCAGTAHICVDECGAPEALAGCKLLAIDTPDGKLTPELVRTRLHGFGFQHHAQPKVISISQPTELGTLYTAGETAPWPIWHTNMICSCMWTERGSRMP